MNKKLIETIGLGAISASLMFNIIIYPHPAELFSYFTILSNVFCLLLFLFALIFPKSRWVFQFRGCALTSITLTMLVYHFLLRASDMSLKNLGTPSVLSDFLNHYFVPLFTITYYFLVCRKGKYTFKKMFRWLIFPISYILYTQVYGLCGGKFIVNGEIRPAPYFFLDVELVGLSGMLMWCVIIIMAFIGIAALYVSMDKILAKIQR